MTLSHIIRQLSVGMLAWLMPVFLGGVLIDIAWAVRPAGTAGPLAEAAGRNAADVLLIVGAGVGLVGLTAVGSAWNIPAARKLIVMSLLAFAAEFVIPMVLSPFIHNAPASSAPGPMPWVRLAPLVLASLLAISGFRRLLLGPMSAPA